MSDLRDRKVGDSVFVVHQKKRWASEQRKELVKIAHIGCKYGTLKGYGNIDRFELSTGQSHHGNDHNARVNGRGFDVYRSEEEYNSSVHAANELRRLTDRLVDRFGRLKNLTPESVCLLYTSDAADE